MSVQYQLPFKSGWKIVELGGGDAPLFHLNIDKRRLPTVDLVANLEEGIPLEDEFCDGVFAKFLMEHLSWRKSQFLFQEIYRVLKPGGIAVLIGPNTLEQCREISRRNRITIEEAAMLYGGQEEPGWNEHKAAYSVDYVVQLAKVAGFAKVNINPLPNCATDMVVELYKGVTAFDNIKQAQWFKDLVGFEPTPKDLKLNIGSFTVMAKGPGWVNIDRLDLSQYAKEHGYLFRKLDVRNPLPYTDESISLIVTSHLLEHLTRDEGERFLKECLRVLKKKGTIRITVPDARLLAKQFVAGKIMEHASHNEDVKKASDEAAAFLHLLMGHHETIYDAKSLRTVMERAGFSKVAKMNFGESSSKEIMAETKDMYPELSLYMEGAKPEEQLPAVTTIGARMFPKEKLKIALISTAFFGVPPKKYSGLEMIVWDLAVALSGLGHEVTLIAPKGSQAPPNGKLIETIEALYDVQVDWIKAERDCYEVYKDKLKEFDIVHGHNWFGFEYAAKAKETSLKVCHTHHGGLNLEYWGKSKPPFKLNLIAISEFMSKVYKAQGFESKFVYNGIDMAKYKFKGVKGDRLLFVGRIDSFKQPHVAIEVAKRLNMGLDIVGGTFVQDKAYLEKIRSMCTGDIVFHPDASQEEKVQLMQDARCLLFPSQMGEPFGLVAVESMATGTPVVALNDGAIEEVVKEGGIVCPVFEKTLSPRGINYRLIGDPVVAMCDAVHRIQFVKPKSARKNAERFSRENMAKRYVRLYSQILTKDGEW